MAHVDPPGDILIPRQDPGSASGEGRAILPLVVFDATPMLGRIEPRVERLPPTSWPGSSGMDGCRTALSRGTRTDLSKDSDLERFKRQPFPRLVSGAIQFLYEQRGIVANGLRIDGHRRPPI